MLLKRFRVQWMGLVKAKPAVVSVVYIGLSNENQLCSRDRVDAVPGVFFGISYVPMALLVGEAIDI
jgi:hypothetical protein